MTDHESEHGLYHESHVRHEPRDVVQDLALRAVLTELQEIRRTQYELLHAVARNHHQGEQILMGLNNFDDVLGRIDTATTNIAADLRRLKDQISTGMSPSDVAALKAKFEAKATTLEGIAADTADPVPEEPTGGSGETEVKP